MSFCSAGDDSDEDFLDDEDCDDHLSESGNATDARGGGLLYFELVVVVVSSSTSSNVLSGLVAMIFSKLSVPRVGVLI